MRQLTELLVRARARARELGRPVLAGVSEQARPIDALDVLAAVDPGMYWATPSKRFAIAGSGAAAEITASDPDRFRNCRDAWTRMRDEAVVEASSSVDGAGPILMGGFAFDADGPRTDTWTGFGAASFTVPKLAFVRDAGRATLMLSALVTASTEPEAVAETLARLRERAHGATDSTQPTHMAPNGVIETQAPIASAAWRSTIERAVAAIRRGVLDKIVLARELITDVPGVDRLAILRHFVQEHPTTFVYAVWRGDAVFVGATPERFARVRDREMSTSVLAGSAARGNTPLDTAASGRALQSSLKDRNEHDIVRRDIEAHLGAICEDVRVGKPRIVTLRNLLHLHTPVTARLREGGTIFDVLEALHPTPAVGGSPREPALRFIREHEGIDRGWYAGPIGWTSGDVGEFAVALRCTLVRDRAAYTFAGCGIVAQSDADAEWVESALKMQTALDALHAGIAAAESHASPAGAR